LTRQISKRYRIRFEQEHAAQGFFDSVLCCSGPFSAYRRSALMRVWPSYLRQTFLRVRCTAGDDLHLTNLMLADDHLVVYEPCALAFTHVPSTISRYVRQQLRWNRSFYRELLWTVPALLGRRHPFLAFDVAARTLLPFLLAGALLLSAGEALWAGRELFVYDLSLIGAMVFVHGLMVVLQTRNTRFLVLYGLLYVTVLIPVRLRALLTLGDTRWITRESRERPRTTVAS